MKIMKALDSYFKRRLADKEADEVIFTLADAMACGNMIKAAQATEIMCELVEQVHVYDGSTGRSKHYHGVNAKYRSSQDCEVLRPVLAEAAEYLSKGGPGFTQIAIRAAGEGRDWELRDQLVKRLKTENTRIKFGDVVEFPGQGNTIRNLTVDQTNLKLSQGSSRAVDNFMAWVRKCRAGVIPMRG